MLRRLAVPFALCLGAFGGPLHALGLGAIRVESSLNQPFSATIPFTSLSSQEAENLRVRIAENRDFTRAGIDRSSYLSSLKLETIVDDGNPRIVLRGSQIAREPLLTILIDVRAGGPRVLREYTVFLDPPGSRPVPQSAPDPVPVPVPGVAAPSTPRAAAAPTAPTAEELAEIERARATGQFGPIRDGEALWKIAERLRPEDRRYTRSQMMLALYDLNPQAFENGDIGRVIVGRMLQIPADEQVAATGPVAANKLVVRLAEQGGPLPDRTAPASKPIPAPATAPAEVVDPASEAPADAEATNAEAEVPIDAEDPVSPDVSEPEAAAVKPTAAARAAGPRKAALPREESDSLLQVLLPWLAGLLGLLLLIAIYRAVRQRGAQAEYAAASRAAGSASAVAGAATAAARPRSVLEELEEVNRRLAAEDGSSTSVPGSAEPAPAMAPKSDFDSTGAFSPNTFEIDLSDNDPISEADFHLAYGLYDEAALLLRTAAEKDPARVELSVKLAETYFAAGKADEFLSVAETLAPRLDPTAWEKVAILGRQICPESELFQRATEGGELSVDLSLDDAPAPATGAPLTRIDEGLDFMLEELELPPVVPEKPAAGAAPSLADFDLGSFELDAASAPAGNSSGNSNSLDFTDFDLGGLKLEGADARDLDLKLDDVTGLSMDEDFGEGQISSGDDVGTKLDLARAYVEMGDLEMARSLLDEVDVQGSDEQKHEASQLRERMLG